MEADSTLQKDILFCILHELSTKYGHLWLSYPQHGVETSQILILVLHECVKKPETWIPSLSVVLFAQDGVPVLMSRKLSFRLSESYDFLFDVWREHFCPIPCFRLKRCFLKRKNIQVDKRGMRREMKWQGSRVSSHDSVSLILFLMKESSWLGFPLFEGLFFVLIELSIGRTRLWSFKEK
jgi:hypothetical protein